MEEERAGCGREERGGAAWWRAARVAADRGAQRGAVGGRMGRGCEARDGEFVRVRTIAGRAGWLASGELGAGGFNY